MVNFMNVEKVMDFCGYPVYAGYINTPAFSDPDRKIVIHKLLLEGDEKLLNYILLHEVAHIELGHVYELNMGAVDIDKEVEADIWAYQHGADYQTIITFLEKECLKNRNEDNEMLYGLNEYRLKGFKRYAYANFESFQRIYRNKKD